jgi:3-methyl-2-oxobutanoate hydroxymethyltransferase
MNVQPPARERRVTVRELLEMKRRGERIVVLTAYDVLFARLVDEVADVVLVGDSLGQVFAGHDSTIPVTLDDMIYHACAVRRGVERALLVVDMPFMTFRVSPEETLRNAALVRAGIPVMGHVGLTPQSVHVLGGYRVQGRPAEDAERLVEDSQRLQDAGAFAIVLELIPAPLAGRVSRTLEIPTIGIGAGAHTDGQVLVLPDALGLNEAFRPRFLRTFANLAEVARAGIASYAAAVRDGSYPDAEHSFE